MNEYIKKRIIAKSQISHIITENAETIQSGIYLYERTDEFGITYFYCGKAKNIFERQIGHWNGFSQRLDKSLHTRKFYNENNLYGWKFKILEFCNEDKLDERESYYIFMNLNLGKQTYNLDYGGSIGKTSTFGNKEQKGYQKGLKQGRKNTQKEIAKLFDKNLAFEINGKPNKNKEKAFEKFRKFIGEI